MGVSLIASLRVAVPASSKKGIYEWSPILECNYLCEFVRVDKDKPNAQPQINEGADAAPEVEGYGGPEVLRYLQLFTEWLAAAKHVATRLRMLIRSDGQIDLRYNLKLSLIQLDVALDAVEQTASMREEIVAYLAYSLDQRKIQDDFRNSAKDWLRCQYDRSQQRHFTVHAEAGLMALVSAIHETGGKVREVIRGHDALRQLETVRAT